MSRAATLIVLIWAAWLTALAALLFAWTPGDWVQWGPFAAAAAAAWCVGLVLLIRRRRPAVTRAILDFSPGAVVIATGLAALAQGASLGVWLVYAGAGLVAVGLGTVIRETLAVRRMRRDT